MSENSLPPLRLNSAMSDGKDDLGSNISLNSRERRRQRLKKDRDTPTENNHTLTENEITPRKKNRRGKPLNQEDLSKTNLGYESDEPSKVNSDSCEISFINFSINFDILEKC